MLNWQLQLGLVSLRECCLQATHQTERTELVIYGAQAQLPVETR